MTSTEVDELYIILVSPNVSEQMGGEAIKALQIYLELKRQGIRVHQITHERVKPELDSKYPDMKVSYLSDTKLERTSHRLGFAFGVGLVFLWRAARINYSLHGSRVSSPALLSRARRRHHHWPN
jgi:hypothetical protein